MSYELSPEKQEAITAIEAHILELSKDTVKNIGLMAHLQFAIAAITVSGCGCGLCLAHNNMKCPRVNTPHDGEDNLKNWTTST